jgi:hypothetical protein
LNNATKPVLGKFPTKAKISMTISNSDIMNLINLRSIPQILGLC